MYTIPYICSAGAPVSKAVFSLTAAASLFLTSRKASLALTSSWLQKKHFLRLFTCHFSFSEPSSILCGLLLLYTFRIFEQQQGSRKYTASIVFISAVSTALQLVTMHTLGISQMTPGYSLIFGLFVQYYADIPKTAKYSVLGVPLSDKTFTYLIGGQLMLNHLPHSFYTAVCGIMAGLIYRSESLPFFHRLCLSDSKVNNRQNYPPLEEEDINTKED